MRPVSIRPKVEALTRQAVGSAQMLPSAPPDLLGDQRVGGVLVGDARQRLRKAHQDDALFRGEPVLVHEGVDAAVLVAVGARSPHQPARQVGDARTLIVRGRSVPGEARDDLPSSARNAPAISSRGGSAGGSEAAPTGRPCPGMLRSP